MSTSTKNHVPACQVRGRPISLYQIYNGLDELLCVIEELKVAYQLKEMFEKKYIIPL